MNPVIGIDPGDFASAFAVWDGAEVLDCGILGNDGLVNRLRTLANHPCPHDLALEVPAILGKQRVHAELLETARWVGVFEGVWRAAGLPVSRITYHRARTHVTRDPNANEAAVKEALISRFAPGCRPRKNVGAFAVVPTGEVDVDGEKVKSSHVWSAVAVAVMHDDTRRAA